MLIGFHGYQGAGKDTAGAIAAEVLGGRAVSFAQGVRDAVYAFNPLVYGTPLRWWVDRFDWDIMKRDPFLGQEVRDHLRRMGTEVGRDLWGDDFWVNQALARCDADVPSVFTDVRYLNEFDAIHRAGGRVVHILRDGYGPDGSGHTSELAHPQLCDATLQNDGTIESLRVKVTRLVEEMKAHAHD